MESNELKKTLERTINKIGELISRINTAVVVNVALEQDHSKIQVSFHKEELIEVAESLNVSLLITSNVLKTVNLGVEGRDKEQENHPLYNISPIGEKQ